MIRQTSLGRSVPGLVKHEVAEKIREEIILGNLEPGDPIVEGQWATKLGVAQASVREALNTLAGDGYVQKSSGKSARVTQLSESDVADLYRLRGAMEGLAARIWCERGLDTAKLEQWVADLEAAIEVNNIQAMVGRDMHFHLCLVENCGNNFLAACGRRILHTFFAFVVMQSVRKRSSTVSWGKTLSAHTRIIELIKAGNPETVQSSVTEAMEAFAEAGYESWMPHDKSASK